MATTIKKIMTGVPNLEFDGSVFLKVNYTDSGE